MLKTVSSFYDPLGIMAPVLIERKHLCRLAVHEKKGWDEEVSNKLQVKWKKWIYGLKTVEVLRRIAPYLEDVTALILHHLIDASKNITWRYVPTDMNHADYGTRASTVEKLYEIGWWEGPDWLCDESNWPKQDEYFEEVRKEVHDEIKVNSELILLSKDVKPDEWDNLLQKCSLRKTRRVTTWCLGFCHNALQQVHSHSRKSAPLKVTELEEADTYWVKREQKVVNLSSKDAQQLGLTKCDDDIIRCIGRFNENQPIFLSRESLYSHKVCVEAHKRVGHKSVNFVMGEVRNK